MVKAPKLPKLPASGLEAPDGNLPSPAEEGWFKTGWRPAMAWQYFAVCLFDFIVFPAIASVHDTFFNGTFHEWHSLTLANGGMYHIAMGTYLGVTSWQRSQEKIAATYTGAMQGGFYQPQGSSGVYQSSSSYSSYPPQQQRWSSVPGSAVVVDEEEEAPAPEGNSTRAD